MLQRKRTSVVQLVGDRETRVIKDAFN